MFSRSRFGEYPDELHDLHNGYPLAPEHIIPPAPKTIKEIDEKFQKYLN